MSLDDVFRCPAIGRYLTVGACLRRQTEKRRVTVVVREASEAYGGTIPRVTEEREGGPAYPACVGCELGREHAAEAAPEPPRAAPPRPAPASVIWSGGVPDVPLPPPPSGVAKPKPFLMFPLSTMVVERRHSPIHQSTSSTDKPAQPAEEDAMPNHPPCSECKSGSGHKLDCSKRPGGHAKKVGRAPASRRTARPHEDMKTREVLAAIEHHETALVALRAELRARRDEIAQALGEAA